ncbi:hypothetical protein BCH308197_3670 [Bacillus cereus H3081.97]|uniref:hypothetical protein n=1 Tax=Bacillus cereus group TaxID=86661 RepID=UPI00016B6FF8|nr:MULTISPECIES: hypothetical protein [Bacillus cereus group]EDZ57032.1 hypothetical protein BCH308197_3670 [Bacillus cereus H3081.97]KLA04194.1 hypothetical protein B4086_3538 [Bacillus cereus]KXI69388.1 hypothetical protein ACS51_12670 [Bacillus cereus]MCC2431342.1 hypothetical protein [Bacillus paranthracis]MDX5913867.1 hypothetical protein [Bacillus cereus group sp. BfR-BA-01026]
MKDLRNLKKAELIGILVDQFGYESADLKSRVNFELKDLIMKEQEFSKQEERQNNGMSVFADDMPVLVVNSTSGRVSYDSELSSRTYIFEGNGDFQTIPYRELEEMKRKHPKFLEWLYILDEEVRKQLQAENTYIEPREVERLFSLETTEMLERINEYKGGSCEVIYCSARQKLKNGEITDLNKIRSLCSRFSWNLEDFIN